jgi:hypothetical protein
MHCKTLLTFLVTLALSTAAWAQTKISGTMQCDKPDPVYTLTRETGRSDHAFTISKSKCTWPKATEIAGTQATASEITSFSDIRENRGWLRGVNMVTMASGDKAFSSSQGSATVKEGTIQSAEGTWNYNGGTGKLRGIRGKGTYKIKAAPDGTRTIEVEGEYQLPK